MNDPASDRTTIAFELLVMDRRVFPRSKVDQERVAFMAELYQEGGLEALPPIEAVHDSGQGKYLVADGHHRVFAAQEAGFDHIHVVFPPIPAEASPVEVAYELGLKAAARSGRPLSRAEQRQAILRVLDENPDRSDAEIATLVGTTRQTVWRIRRIATSDDESDSTGERWATASVSADEIARLLVRSLSRLYDGQGLSDLLLGDRTGRRVAAALRGYHGDGALEWAERLAAWAADAVTELRRLE
jgi:ParB-like chromosome segregation protein Spo0J